MSIKKLGAAIAATVIAAYVPISTLYAGTALASGQRPDRPAVTGPSSGPNAWASRSSNLPSGGAALSFDGVVYGAPHPFKATPVVPNAWATRTSNLPVGGAALYL